PPNAMPATTKKKSKSTVPRVARNASDALSAERVREFAGAGQHAGAIELATTALAATGLPVAEQLTLLELRAESFIALGKLDRAAADAASMQALATAKASRSAMAMSTAQALCTRAMVQMRASEFDAAVKSAKAALKAARAAKHPPLEALALLRLAESQFRVNHAEQ